MKNAKGNRLSVYILLFLYTLNERYFSNKKASFTLWNLIKGELFYVDGACQHSGQCCRDLMIYLKGNPIDTKDKLTQLSDKNHHYRRFVPQSIQKGKIIAYDCHSLTSSNKCRHYETRPLFCQAYPFSHFLAELPFQEGCGYQVSQTRLRVNVRSQGLLKRIRQFCALYGLVYQVKKND